LGLPDTPEGASAAWAAERLKNYYPHAPIIVVTGLNEAEVDTVTIHKAGAVHVLRKPFDPEVLRRLLLDLISGREAKEQTAKITQRTNRVVGMVESLLDSATGTTSKPPSDPTKKK
jgi:DNA-binding response OmpR family regulator